MNFPRSDKSSPALRIARAFSLVELLTVMALVSVLTMATVPALRGTLDGISISGAAGVAAAELSLARQTALSRNLPVEIRIYKHDDGGGDDWRILAVVIPAESSGLARDEWVTAGKILPGQVIIEDTQSYSTILSEAVPTSPSAEKSGPWSSRETSDTAPRLLRDKEYVGFRFRADGSADLPSDRPWCLTLKNPHSKPVDGGPAANFVSLVIESATGRTLSFQP
jgi:uncharacterized protein (TIGR02596 family)